MNTCQICARSIKCKTGVIAHHGYRRPGQGWQTESCFGARFQPYEESCDRIPLAIEKVKTYIYNTKEALRDFIQSPPDSLFIETMSWGQPPKEVKRPDDFDPEATSYQYYSYAYQYRSKKHELEKLIKEAKSDLKFLEERLQKWVAPTH